READARGRLRARHGTPLRRGRGGMMLAVATLWQREVMRFIRQRSRLVGALVQPVVFWLLLGGGLSASFRPAGAAAGVGYLEYFYPGVLALVAFALVNLGLCIAWRMESTQGFHAIMNLLLIPLWLLSGAFFPATGAPRALRWLMRIDPLTYGMAALRRCLYLGDAAPAAGLPGLGLSLAVLAGTTALARRTTA